MIRVGIIGATGYAGVELVRLLLRHPGAELAALKNRAQESGDAHIGQLFESLDYLLARALEKPADDGGAQRRGSRAEQSPPAFLSGKVGVAAGKHRGAVVFA